MIGAVQLSSATVSVSTAGASGLVVWGSIGGVASAAVAIATLVMSVVAGNAKRRKQARDADEQAQRQREIDIREAEKRGRDSLADDLAEARRERDDYRERYLNIIEARRRT